MPRPPTKKSTDPRRTTRHLLFTEHYADRADELLWSVDRLHRLCAALQLTEWELGAMIRVSLCEMARYLRDNRFPAPVELHLTMIERSVLPTSTPNIFPA